MLEWGIIRPLNTTYDTSVLFQLNHKSKQLCVDYKLLNKYMLRLIADLFDQLIGVWIFSKLDQCSDYWHIIIAEEYELKTNCITHYEAYEFLLMSFKLTNVLATFLNSNE